MSYAIGTVIYGVAGNHELSQIIEAKIGVNTYPLYIWEKLGFEFTYEGVSPWWFGYQIVELDETENVNLADLIENLPSKEDMLLKFKEKLGKLPEDIRKIMSAPSLQIVWSSS